jgi:hypothetical protein
MRVSPRGTLCSKGDVKNCRKMIAGSKANDVRYRVRNALDKLAAQRMFEAFRMRWPATAQVT